jgi:DNA-directed RNA polymerase specialized sigma subunit
VNNKKTPKKSIVAVSVVAGIAGGLVAGLTLGIPGFAGASSTNSKGAAVTFAESATLSVTAAADGSTDAPVVVEGAPADANGTVEAHGHRGGRGPKLDAVAEAIGITAEELRTELEAGKSIADVAAAKGVSVDAVIDALVADMKAHLDEEVASGEHTQEEADVKLARFTTRLTEMVNRSGLPAPKAGEGRGPGGGHGIKGGKGLDAAAGAIGVTAEELRTELQAGKSIADVATAKGVSVDAVVEAMVADMKAHLDEKVASGKHTQEEADAKLAKATARITEMVNRTAPTHGAKGDGEIRGFTGEGHGPRRQHGGHGPRGQHGGHGPMGGGMGDAPAANPEGASPTD